MKGILLAGGTGSRLSPMTTSVNKHFLPVYDKPMFYYPLTNLILMGIRDIAIVTSDQALESFSKHWGDGSRLGLNLEYFVQQGPNGLADALLSAEGFGAGHSLALILGDNLFHGRGLGRELALSYDDSGAMAFSFSVSDPQNYGVVVQDADGNVSELLEKPKNHVSDMAVTGLYLLDSSAFERCKSLEVSSRGELEITSLLNTYLSDRRLRVTPLPRGTMWLDCGTVDNLLEASNYVRIVESRTGQIIGDPIEASKNAGNLVVPK